MTKAKSFKWSTYIDGDHVIAKSASREDKLASVLAHLTTSHIFSQGGYPHDYRELDGYVIVADPLLSIFREASLVAWYDRAVDYILSDDPPSGADIDFDEAMNETAEATDEV